MGNWISRLVGMGLFIGGGIALYFGIVNLNHANESEKWPSVPGRITSATVKEERGSKGRRSYKPVVHYSYSVESRGFTGERISFGEHSSSSRQTAEDIANKYRALANVEVFYSPDDPTLCVLEPGANLTVYLLPGVGVLFLLIGGYLTFAMIFSGGESEETTGQAKYENPSQNVNPQDSFDFGPPRR
jgi:hypothetical protein